MTIEEKMQIVNRSSHRDYLSTLSYWEMTKRTAWIVGPVVVITYFGSFFPPYGTAIGAISGVAMSAFHNYQKYQSAYNSWAASHSVEARQTFANKFSELAEDKDLICPISQEAIVEPVQLSTCGVLYNREHLEEWVKKEGTCPITHQKVTLDDIKFNISATNRIHECCKKILGDQNCIEKLTKNEIFGMKLMSQDYKRRAALLFKIEMEVLQSQLKEEKIPAREFAEKVRQLGDAYDPNK